MKVFLKNKKIWFTMLYAMIGITVFCAIFSHINCFRGSPFAVVELPDDIGGGEVYTFDDSGTDDSGNETGLSPESSEYKNTTVFNITEDGLGEFATTVENGCSFEGKEVHLKDDIYWGDTFVPIGAYDIATTFKGTFDGNNHTISCLELWPYRRSYNDYTGLFYKLGGNAIIQNLHLDNVTCYLNNALGGETVSNLSNSYCGSITGFVEAGSSVTIQQCMVTGMSVEDYPTSFSGYVAVGGFVGIYEDSQASGSLTIQDCYISDLKGKLDPNKCLLASLISLFDGKNATLALKSCVAKNSGSAYVNTQGKTTSNCYSNTTSGFSGLGSTNDLHKGGSSGTTWYWISQYNSGYAMLRQFVSGWNTINFKSENTSKGTVSPSNIKVPTIIGTSGFNSCHNSANAEIPLYDQKITATPKTGYSFEKWTYESSNKTYTAHFVLVQYYIEFKQTSDGASPQCGTFETGTSKIKIDQTATVEIELTHSASYTEIKYVIGNHVITYQVGIKYTITKDADYGEITLKGGSKVNILNMHSNYNNMNAGGTYQITPQISLKSYNASFQ